MMTTAPIHGAPGKPQERFITVSVSRKLHDNLTEAAKRDKISMQTLAGSLFQAAAGEYLKPGLAPHLDAAVSRVVMLYGSGHLNTDQIAKMVGLSESTVVRIRDAWKEEMAQ